MRLERGAPGECVSGNLATSAVCGVFTIVALLVIRVPYAVPLGMWAGVADLIPQVGSYLGAIPAVLVGLIKGPAYGIATVLYFIAYQQFENYVLAPRIYQNAIDSPAAVIVSTLIGGSLAGFAGALLALPVAATIKVVTHDVMFADPGTAGGEASDVTGRTMEACSAPARRRSLEIPRGELRSGTR